VSGLNLRHIVRKIRCFPLPEGVNSYVDTQEGKGGGGEPRYFFALLEPHNNDVFGAPNLSSESKIPLCLWNEDEDYEEEKIAEIYFNLKPGEKEVFIIDFFVYPGYFYEFQIGIAYSFEKSTRVNWLPETFKAASPNFCTTWTVKGASEFGLYPDNFRETGFQLLKRNREFEIQDSDTDLNASKLNTIKAALNKLVIENRAFKFPAISGDSKIINNSDVINRLTSFKKQ
jgi:hypothetical protein